MKPQSTLLFLSLLAVAFACQPKKAPESQVPETVTVVSTGQVTRQPLTSAIVSSGVLASKKEAKLSFKTGGIIAHIRVDEGQSVRKGQLLASLNLTEIDAQVSQARNNFEKAQRDLNRTKRLYADSAATLEQMQNATTGYEVAKAALTGARFNQQYSTILAPSDGRILRRLVEEGELVNPGNAIFQFAGAGEADGWIVRTGIADRDVVKLKIGDKAQLTLDAYPGESFPATITEIAGAADPMNGTFEVELKVNSKGKKLVSGLVAKVETFPSGQPEMLVVPIEALAEADGNKACLYTLSEDQQTARKIPVITSGIYGDKVAIREGIAEGTVIVTKGTSYLTDQSKVKVVNSPLQLVKAQ